MEATKLDLLLTRYEEVYWFATRKLSSIVEELFKEITLEQYFAIRYLKKHGPCPASQLAEFSNVNRSAVTAMIDRLHSKGYVTRIRSHNDRRVVHLDVTEAGNQVYQSGEEKLRLLAESLLQQLEDDEMEAFVRIYEKIGKVIADK